MAKDLKYFTGTLPSSHNKKEMLYDIRYKSTKAPKPVIIFIHGFKGFKDWGHFDMMADYFAEADFVFCKFNLSHNGTTTKKPIDFADLEAFKENNFSIELDDVGTIIDHFFSKDMKIPAEEISVQNIFLIGHSRGGGLALLKAHEDDRVKAIVTLAAINDFKNRWSEEYLQQWKDEGVQHVFNSRTQQNMPMGYQLIENLKDNAQRLDIPEAVKKLKQPALIVHGTDDQTLPVSMAHEIKTWNPAVKLLIVEGANHTFGGSHPFPDEVLPKASQDVFEEVKRFLKTCCTTKLS